MVKPVSQTALPGASITLFVVAAGDQPLSYQWRGNGINLIEGVHVSGSKSSALTLIGVSSSDAQAYSVIVSNTLRAQASSEAELSVVSVTAPGIVQTLLHSFMGGPDGSHPNGLTPG